MQLHVFVYVHYFNEVYLQYALELVVEMDAGYEFRVILPFLALNFEATPANKVLL